MRTEYLLEKELSLVLASLMPSNRLVCEVSLHTGLRVSDVLALRTSDLVRADHFWITEQKTGKRKMFGVPAELRERLLAQAGEVFVFPNRFDEKKHRTRQTVWKDIKRAQRAFRLPENIGTHSMRKVYAVDLRRKYGSVSKVQRALNHSDSTVTMLYAMADALLAARGVRHNAIR